jgi:hypothetical protein
MQLESTLFACCVVQIKPQLEQLLCLPPGALTKEIALTQQLIELFIDYQVCKIYAPALLFLIPNLCGNLNLGIARCPLTGSWMWTGLPLWSPFEPCVEATIP